MIPIDASSLKILQCSRRYYITCVLGISQPSPEMAVGKAIHIVLEKLARREVPNIPELMPKVPQQYHVNFLASTEYLRHREDLVGPPALDKDGNPCVEWRFNFPIGEMDEEQIILCGTIDYIELQNYLIVRDYKTSRSTKIPEVLKMYQMQLQVYFYIWVIKNFLYKFFGPTEQALIKANKVIGQIRGIFLSFVPLKIEDSEPLVLTQSLEEDIPTILIKMIEKAYLLHKCKELPPPEGMAYGICKDCPYYSICVTRDTCRIKQILAQMEQNPYDPTNF